MDNKKMLPLVPLIVKTFECTKNELIIKNDACQSSSPPIGETTYRRGSHTTVRTGHVYGGSLSYGETLR